MIEKTRLGSETDSEKKNDKTATTIDEKIKTKLYENRVIFFNEDIDEKTSTRFCKELYALYYENASPITLKLTTYGGLYASSYRMVASIEEVKKKATINCECAGTLASGGVDVMLSCSKRISHPTTIFLLHHHSGGNHGRYDEHLDARKMDDMIAEMRVKTVVKYSNLSYEEVWDKMYRKEWWLSPEEMMSYGMLDEVLS